MAFVKAFTRGNYVKVVLPGSARMAALQPRIAQPHTLWLSDLEKQVVLNQYELAFDDASAVRPPSFVRELCAGEQLSGPATLCIPLPSLFADPRSVPETFEGTMLLNFKASVRTLDDDEPCKKEPRRVAYLRSECGYDFSITLWNAHAVRTPPLGMQLAFMYMEVACHRYDATKGDFSFVA